MDGSDDDSASEGSSRKYFEDDDDDYGLEDDEEDPFFTDDDDDYKFPESEESDDDDEDDDDDISIEKEKRTRKTDKENENKSKDVVSKMDLLKTDDVEEGDIIIKFMKELGELPDLYTKLSPDDVLDELEDSELSSAIASTTEPQPGSSSKMADDDDDDMLGAKKSGKEKGVRRKTVLNPTLQGLMGEANLCFARGRLDMAEKICLEIIRQNPLASEPFFTLASIYEAQDNEKFLSFLTIAVHLRPSDREQWIRIAEMHIAQGNLAQARVYYTKAIKNLPKDYDLRLRKAKLLEQLGDETLAQFTYLRMIPYVPPERHEFCIGVAKRLASYYHKIGKVKYGMDAMISAYNVCGKNFTIPDLNIFMDLLILNNKYRMALNILQESTSFFIETDENSKDNITLCLIPEEIIPALRSKICVCLVKLQCFLLSDYIIDNLLDNIPFNDGYLDLFVDVTDAFMEEGKYEEALKILQPVIEQVAPNSHPLIWLKKAECFKRLNLCEDAINSYEKVVELAPNCHHAKVTLSELLKAQGHLERAIAVLDQDLSTGERVYPQIFFEKCSLFKQLKQWDKYFEAAYILLSRYSISLKNREELFALANGGNFYNPDGLKVILNMRNIIQHVDSSMQEFNRIPKEKTDITIDDEFELFLEVVNVAFKIGNHPYVEKLCFAMITTKRFIQYHSKLEPILILSCYFNDDCTIGFSYLRELVAKHPQSNEYWNQLSLFIQKGQHLRYQRFIRRLVARISNIRQMRIFVAHYHLHCCSFKYALNIYVPLFKEYQQPIIALCIAVIFNQLSLQKKVLRKSAALAQSITFAHKYSELRGLQDKNSNSPVQQEIFYNIGRIYHQAGLNHLAVDYYEKALAIENPLVQEHENFLGLRQEVAFNLHLIYRNSGNLRKARQYLYQYIII